MGHNIEIKRFDTHPTGQPMDLFAAQESKLPTVREILRSPWVRRGSDLPSRDGEDGSRCVEEPCNVEWDAQRRAPVAFTWRQRRRQVDAVAGVWTLERAWWDRRARLSRRCFRVIAAGGVYVLAYDRLARSWILVGVLD